MKPQHLAFILLIDLIWAVNTVAVKFAVTAVPPMTMVFIRYLMVFAVCAPQLRWVSGRMGVMVLAGLFAGALAMGLGGLSFHLADNVSALAIAAQLGVPFSLIIAIIFLGERIRWLRAAGIALSFVGVAVIAVMWPLRSAARRHSSRMRCDQTGRNSPAAAQSPSISRRMVG